MKTRKQLQQLAQAAQANLSTRQEAGLRTAIMENRRHLDYALIAAANRGETELLFVIALDAWLLKIPGIAQRVREVLADEASDAGFGVIMSDTDATQLSLQWGWVEVSNA